jgi:hypothetical protein
LEPFTNVTAGCNQPPQHSQGVNHKMDSYDRNMDEQIKQVLAEETYSRSDWPAQAEYIAASVCCWSEECEDLLKVAEEGDFLDFFDEEALLVSGCLLRFESFRLNSL